MNASNAIRARQKRAQSLTQQPIQQLFLRLFPSMLIGVCALLVVDAFDSWLIAQTDTLHLTALGFTVPVTNLLFAFAIAMSICVKAVLSQTISRNQVAQSRRLATSALLVATALGLSVSVFGLVTISPTFSLLGVDYALIPDSFHMGPKPDLMPLITPYVSLRYAGFVLWMLPIVISAMMRAAGHGKLSGYYLASWATVTILLDGGLFWLANFDNPLLAIALGHLAADSLFCLIGLMQLTFKERLIRFKGLSWHTFRHHALSLSRIGLPATLVNILTPCSIFLLTTLISRHGTEPVAALGLFLRIEPLLLLIPMAMTSLLPTIIGHNHAAELHQRVSLSIRLAFKAVIVSQLLVALVVFIIRPSLSQFFNLQPQVAYWFDYALLFLPICLTGYGLFIVATSCLNALLQPLMATSLSVIRLFLLLTPAVFVGHWFFGALGILLGFGISNLIAGAIALLVLLRYCGRNRKQLQSSPLDQ